MTEIFDSESSKIRLLPGLLCYSVVEDVKYHRLTFMLLANKLFVVGFWNGK